MNGIKKQLVSQDKLFQAIEVEVIKIIKVKYVYYDINNLINYLRC